MGHMSSASFSDHADDDEQTFGKILSIKTDYSPRSRTQTAEEQTFGRILSIKTNDSPRSRTQTAEDIGFMVSPKSCSPRNSAHTEYCRPPTAILSPELNCFDGRNCTHTEFCVSPLTMPVSPM